MAEPTRPELPPPSSQEGMTSLGRALTLCRNQLIAVGIFSGVVNLLQLIVPIYMLQLFDRVLPTRSFDTLFYLTLMAFLALVLFALLEGIRARVMQRIGLWLEQRLAPEAFARALESQLRGRPYRLDALRDLASCRSFIASPAALAMFDVPWVPIYLGVIFLFHPLIGLTATIGAVLLFALTLLNEMAIAAPLKETGNAALLQQRRAEALLRNAEVIDSMGMYQAVMARWRAGMEGVNRPLGRALERTAPLVAATRFLRLAVQIAVLGLGIYLTIEQQITAGAAIAGSIIMSRALAPVELIIGAWRQLVPFRQSWRRLQNFLALPRIRPDTQPLPEPEGRITVERTSFTFPGTVHPVLKGISFTLEPGESLGVIGPSAAGKTTLLRLLIGTLQPSAGSVRLDGADVYLWQRADFGRYVGYLPQDVELFEGTVRANIARLTDALPEAVYEAARLAGAHDMILRLPQGYETQIGEGGMQLSAGQRQQIGLARAFFGKPRLVVLDEPNANLDGEAEAALLAALAELKRRRITVVLVSHRLGLIQGVDKVLVLREGMVESFGPRAEVMKRFLRPALAPLPAATPSP